MQSHDGPRPQIAPARLALDELLAELLRQTRAIVGVRDGLWRLIEAIVSIASTELTLATVLKRVVEVARDMVDAEYAALGVIAGSGGLREFVHDGIDERTVARIGRLPEGHGILGLLIDEPQVLRLDDLSDHAASVGFPTHHPPMHGFLGVPIVVRDRVYGNLYLTNRRGGERFTGDDVELVTTLASAAGVVIDNARLHDEALRRERWLEATRDLTGDLLAGAGTAHVEALIAARARELADAATSVLVRIEGAALVVVAADGLHAEEIGGQRFALEGSKSATALEVGHAIAFDDLSGTDLSDEPLAIVAEYGPAMIVPLSAERHALGTLSVAREKASPPFDTRELRAAEGFAAQAALALDYGHAQAERRRAAVFTERERIGRDLHDLVIQRLFSTGLELHGVTGRVADPDIAGRLDQSIEQIDAAITDLRSSIFGLHARRSGASTVRRQLDELCRSAGTALGFVPDYDIDETIDTAVPDEMVVDLLAVVREGLANIGRHAHASTASLRLSISDGTLLLELSDDGRGIAAGGRRSGLVNLRARAERLGGGLDVASSPGGTRLRWSVPVPPQ